MTSRTSFKMQKIIKTIKELLTKLKLFNMAKVPDVRDVKFYLKNYNTPVHLLLHDFSLFIT